MDIADKLPPLPEGWVIPDTDWAASLLSEFRRELPAGHLLHGRRVELISAREATDDVLFQHLDELDRFTVVHLTWLGREEINANYPCVEFDGDFAGFTARELRLLGDSGNPDAEPDSTPDGVL